MSSADEPPAEVVGTGVEVEGALVPLACGQQSKICNFCFLLMCVVERTSFVGKKSVVAAMQSRQRNKRPNGKFLQGMKED